MCFEIVSVIFDSPYREYHPGEQLSCEIIIRTTCLWRFFVLKNIVINITCPYRSSHVPYFQFTRVATKESSSIDDQIYRERYEREALISKQKWSREQLL